FFNSRRYARPRCPSIGQLTTVWLDDIFGCSGPVYPRVWLREKDVRFARGLRQRLRFDEDRATVALNFGVGGNLRETVSQAFESALLNGIVAGGNSVVLDKGLGKERASADELLRSLRRKGHRVLEVAETREVPREQRRRCDVIAWEGGVGIFSAILESSGAYIG